MKFFKSVVLAAFVLGTAATAHADTLSDDETYAGICIIANQGVYTAASQRQAGISKSAAKKQLDKDLAQLSKSFSSQHFVNNIRNVWYTSLDKVYQMPVMDNEDGKAQFVSIVTEEAFVSCMDNFGQ